MLWDDHDVDKIDSSGAVTHFVDYAAGTDYPVYALCDDGTKAFWATRILDAGVPKTVVYKKVLTGFAGDSPTTTEEMFKSSAIVINRGVMEYVKDRIILAANNSIYEFSSSATALPTALYTHSDTDIVFTSVAASGSAIYVAGYSGIQSSIFKFTLNTSTGLLPTLTTAITTAEMPAGERIHKIKYYLGYMLIGTDKGIRIATASDVDGAINYGPLLVETSQPCYDFAVRDRFVWCATGVDGTPGVIRIDLGAEIEQMRFAYANDLNIEEVTGYATTSCAFSGETDRLVFCTTALTMGSISNKALTGNVATLTTSAAHNLVAGDKVWVEGVDSTFNGQYTVATAPTTTTFTYAKTASNVTAGLNNTSQIGLANLDVALTAGSVFLLHYFVTAEL